MSANHCPAPVQAQVAETLGVDVCSLSLQQQGDGSHGLLRWRVNGGGREALLKVGGAKGQLREEAAALRALGGFAPEAVVTVLSAGEAPPFLLIAWLQQVVTSADAMTQFGRSLAEMHRASAAHPDNPGRYGLASDNWLGGTRQRNAWEDDWPTFVACHRLGQQRELLEQRRVEAGYLRRLDDLIARLPDLLAPSGSSHLESSPCLIHGDLWSGNLLLDQHSGQPQMIDPAPCWGRREAELGMTRLFGGLPHQRDFWRGYHRTWPLTAQAERRIAVFELYHLLNHWTLFGDGYRGACERVLGRLRG